MAELVTVGTPFRFCRDKDHHRIRRRMWGLERPLDHPGGGAVTGGSPPWGLGEQSQGEQRADSHPHCACLLFTGSCPAGPSTPFEEAFEIWKNMALSLEESLTF